MARTKAKRRGRKKTTIAVNGTAEKVALDTLAKDYKAFKKENPAKAARVPLSIKQQANGLREAGATYSEIAIACGIAIGSVKAWIDQQQEGRTTPGKPGPKPRHIQGASLGGKISWVKIRFEGREVEVSKTDFWELLKGGLEASM